MGSKALGQASSPSSLVRGFKLQRAAKEKSADTSHKHGLVAEPSEKYD
jgi:hypothetical protein